MKKLISNFLFTSVVTSSLLANINDSEMIYYNFDDNIVDQSSNSYDSDGFGDIKFTDGVIGEALSIGKNTQDLISIHSDSKLEDFTISFFVKFNEINSDSNTILSVANSDELNALIVYHQKTPYNSGWKIDINGKVTTFVNEIKMDDNKFHHIVISREGDKATLYIDNIKNSINSISNNIVDFTGSSVLLGQEQDSLGGGFDKNQALNGVIDEFRIHNRALSNTEIDRLYNIEYYSTILYNLTSETNKTEFEKTFDWYARLKDWKYKISKEVTYKSYNADTERLIIDFDLSELNLTDNSKEFYVSTEEASDFYTKDGDSTATFVIAVKPNDDKQTTSFYLENVELDDISTDNSEDVIEEEQSSVDESIEDDNSNKYEVEPEIVEYSNDESVVDTENELSINIAINNLLGKQEINGYFIHYSSGAYDWAYIPPNKTYVAKLEGMKDDGNLNWSILHSSTTKAFKTIDISADGKKVTFGELAQDLPGSSNALSILANSTNSIDGYFIHYEKGAYDWAYIPPSKAYVVKLEGMKDSGNLEWQTLHSSQESNFSEIDISSNGKYITFINQDTKILPGQ